MISDNRLRRVLPEAAVALLGDLIRALLWLLVFIIWAAYAQIYVRMIRLTITHPEHSDFTIFYYTARFVLDGLPMYGLSPARYGVAWEASHLGNLNPPHFQVIAIPFGYLAYGHAAIAWVLLNLAALILALAVIVRELGIAWSWRRLAKWGAVTMALAPFTTVAITAEMTFLLMLPLTLAWRGWRRDQWATAGAWLGFCASLKLFLLLFVPWLVLRRQWRTLMAFTAGLVAPMMLGLVVFGVAPYQQWVETLGRVGWWWLPMNASWHGFVSRVLAGGGEVAPLLHLPALVPPLALAGGCLLSAIALLTSHQSRDGRDRSFLILLIGAVLASPLGWVYYLPITLGPILGWSGAGQGRGWDGVRALSRKSLVALFAAAALLYVPHETTMAWQPSGLASLTAGSAYFWGTLLIWLTLVANPGR